MTRAAAGVYTGLGTEAIRAGLEPYFEAAPFTATAFNTALEMLAGDPLLAVERPVKVPVLGLLHATETPDIERESAALFGQGFTTLKVKVGFDAARDAAMVERIQRVLHGRGLIRLDANQGYSCRDVCRFAANLAPEGRVVRATAAGDWKSRAVAMAIVPMMLDDRSTESTTFVAPPN